MRLYTTRAKLVYACLFFVLASMHAEAEVTSAKVVMTDSVASGLAPTKRIAITNVMVSFQASVGGDKTNTSGLFAAKTDASTSVQMPEMDTKLLGEITDEIYAQLKADLTASGFEVLPEATVVASPAYQKIIKEAGISNFSKFADKSGDVMLVGASSLKPYLAYNAETGAFGYPSKHLIKGWVSISGASSTPGGPTGTSIGTIYKLPGLEVELAKELNANVLKATYVVTLGSTKASVDRFSSSHQNTYTGTAFVQVGLRADQTRIAFRTPAAKSKGESTSHSISSNFGDKSPPAKDGDVVVTLAESLAGGTDFFAVQEPSNPTGSGIAKFLLGSGNFGKGADVQFNYIASISDPAAYHADVVAMVKVAQRDMLNLVKP